jgi:tetratricopeptide (TPR) repeat protein
MNGATPVAQPPATEHPGIDSDIDPENGWHVRRGMGKGEAAAPAMDEDPFENNPRLADLRRRIDERLRRKKCDEAAALLQELAQETGGRVVAELAMNAGDRCQSLGKSNAALNCYLAGSRADPVYELPLSRLADICIDDQDTELAVSYLERIARLYRFRGDDKAALRVYRRIATIAPYREDVLTLLLNVQNTGRFES